MAGVSTKEIKNRIRSMESTKQITKAMEMVASSKLRKAQTQVMNTRPYFEILHKTIQEIVKADREVSSGYLCQRPVKKTAYVIIGGDRGLAGGYNSNVFKLLIGGMQSDGTVVLPIGRKAVDYFESKQMDIWTKNYREADAVTVGDCFSVAKQLCKAYLRGEIDEIFVVYTRFVSVLSQIPECMRLLPLKPECTAQSGCRGQMVYEPDSNQVLEAIIPEYVGGLLYGALCESRASEQAARRTAMDAATHNAEDMIADLRLKFNQARQSAITQEITEIIAGS